MSDERKFDALLSQELTALAPEQIPAGEVNPWQRLTRQLIWGLALTLMSINHWNLNYILPTVGLVLLLLFYRAMRRENRWFFRGWVLAVVLVLHWGGNLVLKATWLSTQMPDGLVLFNSCALSLMQVVQALCLWQGLLALQRKAGQTEPRAGCTAVLVVFHSLSLVAALFGGVEVTGLLGWVTIAAVVALYVAVIRGLMGISKLMQQSGYSMNPAPVKVPDTVLGWGVSILCLVCVAVGMLCFARYPMDYAPVTDDRAGLESVEEQLLALGFPENVLKDLSDEDLARLEGATRFETDTALWWHRGPYSDQAPYSEEALASADWQYLYTAVIVEVPARTEGMARREVIYHFTLLEQPLWRGTEMVRADNLWYNYDGDLEGVVTQWVDPSGRLLCTKDGVTYAADFYEQVAGTSSNFFFEKHTTAMGYSWPRQGGDLRGYLLYGMERPTENLGVLSTQGIFGFQIAPWQYPFESAAEKAVRLGWEGGRYETLLLTYLELAME